MDKEKLKKLFNDGSMLNRNYEGHEQMLMNEGTFIEIVSELLNSAGKNEIESSEPHLPLGGVSGCFIISEKRLRDLLFKFNSGKISFGKVAEELNNEIVNKITDEKINKKVSEFINNWQKSNPTLDKDFYWSGVNDGAYLIANWLRKNNH